MSSVAGNIVVAAAVVASVAYAVTTLGPKSWRARLFAALARGALKWPWLLGSRALALRMAGRLDAASLQAGGCGGCGNCGSATPPGVQPASGGGPAAGEVRVPLAKIGRR